MCLQNPALSFKKKNKKLYFFKVGGQDHSGLV